MSNQLELSHKTDRLINQALREDLNELGDVTSKLLVDKTETGLVHIVTKQEGVIAGLSVAKQVFQQIDPGVYFNNLLDDGTKAKPSVKVAEIYGPVASILTAERTALNFLQRLSGIATLTAKFVEQVQGTRARILDTRKTTPGLRMLEKYAVRIGGGENHRMGLYDMVLIKENHIRAAGSISNAVAEIRKGLTAKELTLKIEVETRNLAEVRQAIDLDVDRIMLDNMSLNQIRKAVDLAAHKVELEISGGVTLDNVRDYAETGVDYISVGCLTHSVEALDLSLLLE